MTDEQSAATPGDLVYATAVPWVPPALLGLIPRQAEAVPLLAEFERHHPGVKVLWPHHLDEPWRFLVEAETIPGDGRSMTGHRDGPAELLAGLEALFADADTPP